MDGVILSSLQANDFYSFLDIYSVLELSRASTQAQQLVLHRINSQCTFKIIPERCPVVYTPQRLELSDAYNNKWKLLVRVISAVVCAACACACACAACGCGACMHTNRAQTYRTPSPSASQMLLTFQTYPLDIMLGEQSLIYHSPYKNI